VTAVHSLPALPLPPHSHRLQTHHHPTQIQVQAVQTPYLQQPHQRHPSQPAPAHLPSLESNGIAELARTPRMPRRRGASSPSSTLGPAAAAAGAGPAVVSVLQLACCAPAPEPKVQQAHRLEQLQSQTSECLQNMTGEAVLTCTSSTGASSSVFLTKHCACLHQAPGRTAGSACADTLTVLPLPGELVLSSCWASSRPSNDTRTLPGVLPLPLLVARRRQATLCLPARRCLLL